MKSIIIDLVYWYSDHLPVLIICVWIKKKKAWNIKNAWNMTILDMHILTRQGYIDGGNYAPLVLMYVISRVKSRFASYVMEWYCCYGSCLLRPLTMVSYWFICCDVKSCSLPWSVNILPTGVTWSILLVMEVQYIHRYCSCCNRFHSDWKTKNKLYGKR